MIKKDSTIIWDTEEEGYATIKVKEIKTIPKGTICFKNDLVYIGDYVHISMLSKIENQYRKLKEAYSNSYNDIALTPAESGEKAVKSEIDFDDKHKFTVDIEDRIEDEQYTMSQIADNPEGYEEFEKNE